MVDGGIKGRRVAHWPQLLNKVFLLVGVVDVRALDHKARANQVLTVSAEIHVLTVAAQPAAQIRLKKLRENLDENSLENIKINYTELRASINNASLEMSIGV